MTREEIMRELHQALASLEMMSQVSAVSMGSSTRDAGEDIGGKRPSGGEDHSGDRESDWKLKSVAHFRRRIARAEGLQTLEAILKDARAAISAWKRQPAPEDRAHPMPGEYNWKRWVAESVLSDVEIARKCSVSRQYVSKVRTQYRTVEAA